MDLPLVRRARGAGNGYRDYQWVAAASVKRKICRPSFVLTPTCLSTASAAVSRARTTTLSANTAKAIASPSDWITAAPVVPVSLSARPVDVTEQATINSKTEMQRIVVNTAFISLRNSIESADQTESTHHRYAMKA